MSLYLEHFGLSEAPFRITPHTDFFFTGANRGPTLEALVYAITQDEGIVKVTGEVGSGKTTLCRMLLEKLPAEVETLYLANPLLSREEILAAIADELGVPASAATTHSRIRALQEALIERYAAGKRVVLLIDEAHAMPAESLEEIRLLSNLEAKSNKLLQIALFAQPEIDERLTANHLRQLRERITQHFTLAPLQTPEVANYIEFRLRAAGYRGPNPFTQRAVALIARRSEGLSRRINILADKALLAAYSNGNHQVDQAEVATAVIDARFAPLLKKTPPPWRLLAIVATAVALLGVGLVIVFLVQNNGQQPPDGATHTAPPPAAAHPPASAPAEITPKLAPVANPTSTSAASAPAATPTATSAPSPQASQPAAPAAETPSSRYSPLLQQHMTALQPWLASAKPSAYFIQLFTTDAQSVGEAEKVLARCAPLLDTNQLRAYRSSLSGRDRIGIVYGEYPSRASAIAAMYSLPRELGNLQPYPRQVERLLQ